MPYEYALVEKYVRKAEEGGLLPEEAAFVLQSEQGLREGCFWVGAWRWQVALVETIQGFCGLYPFMRAEFDRLGLGEFQAPPVRFEWVAVLAREMEKVTKELRQRDCLVKLNEPAPLCLTAVAAVQPAVREQKRLADAPEDPRSTKRARLTSPLPAFKEVFGSESPPPAPRVGRVTFGDVEALPFSPARPYSPTAPPYELPSPDFSFARYCQ